MIESKNDYEYILFEDMKAAGCEPVALQSGYNGNELGAYMELRDNRVVAVRPQPGPRQAQRQLPHAGRNPRPLQRAAHAGLGDVRAGAPRQLRRAEAQHCGANAGEPLADRPRIRKNQTLRQRDDKSSVRP